MIIRSSDFIRESGDGFAAGSKFDTKTNPCKGCDLRQKCRDESIACLRFRTYMSKAAEHKQPEFWMSRSMEPSKRYFDEVYGCNR